MNVKELKVGNTVQDYNERLVTVSNSIIYFFEKIGCDQNTALIPIQLTEEWLIKLGFEINDDGFYVTTFESKHENNGTEANCFIDRMIIDALHVGRKSYIVWLCNSVSDKMVCYRLTHVHQLQNLYFALTNEELKINNHEN